MLSNVKSTRLIKQLLTITCLMGLMMLLPVSNVICDDWVKVSVTYSGHGSGTPPSLESAVAWVCDDNTDKIVLSKMNYSGGVLSIHLNDLFYYGLLEKDLDTLCISAAWGLFKATGVSFDLDKGPYLGTLVLIYCQMASLEYFIAEIDEDDGKPVLKWMTIEEDNNAGFNILKSTSKEAPDDEWTKVNSILIPPKGAGVEYSAKDGDVEPGTTYYYRLEDIDLEGKSTIHYDFTVEVTTPQKLIIMLQHVDIYDSKATHD